MAVASSMLVLLGVMTLMLIGLTGLAGGAGSGTAFHCGKRFADDQCAFSGGGGGGNGGVRH